MQQVGRLIFIAASTTTTTSSTTTTGGTTCPPPPPLPTAICTAGVWTVNQTVTNNQVRGPLSLSLSLLDLTRSRQTLPIGSGSVVVLGNFTQTSSGILEVEVTSSGIGSLHVNGCATLDGLLTLTFTAPPTTSNEKVRLAARCSAERRRMLQHGSSRCDTHSLTLSLSCR
jgi:hypothetical protein